MNDSGDALDYQYGGQWFDDMGSLALSFMDSPIMGVSLARTGASRAQVNDMAKNILASGITPYDDNSIGMDQADIGV